MHEMANMAGTDHWLKFMARSYACVAPSSSPMTSDRLPSCNHTDSLVKRRYSAAVLPGGICCCWTMGPEGGAGGGGG